MSWFDKQDDALKDAIRLRLNTGASYAECAEKYGLEERFFKKKYQSFCETNYYLDCNVPQSEVIEMFKKYAAEEIHEGELAMFGAKVGCGVSNGFSEAILTATNWAMLTGERGDVLPEHKMRDL